MNKANLPCFTKNDLTNYMKFIHNDPNIKIVYCDLDENLMDISLSRKLRGGKEDEFYIENDYHRKNVRRGNSVYKLAENSYTIARKGLQKFFYLEYHHLDENAIIITRKKNQKKTQKKEIKQIIFDDIDQVFLEGNRVQIYKLEKANGENCQISYLKEIDSWIIASKNVSLSAKEVKDLEPYKNIRRFYFAYLIALTWFDTLNSQNISIELLKEDLKNKTLVGEYCGNPNHQHLIKYEKPTLFFYAIVDHNSEKSCIPPHLTYEFFKKYNFSTVSIKDFGIVKSFNDLKKQLKEIFESVAQSFVEEEGEGSVIYFANVNENNIPEKVLTLCKIKTLEYSIFRKLREKLKAFVSHPFHKNCPNKKEKLLKDFKSQTKDLCANFKPPRPFHYYFKIAEKCFKEVGNLDPKEKIQDSYLAFLTKIRGIIEKEGFEEGKGNFQESKEDDKCPKEKDKSKDINENQDNSDLAFFFNQKDINNDENHEKNKIKEKEKKKGEENKISLKKKK